MPLRRAPPADRSAILGASLARRAVQLIFNAIADAMPDIRETGDPVRLRSGWINGIKQLPVAYR